DTGLDLLKYGQQLAADRDVEIGDPGGVAARPGDAGREPAADWIGDDNEHDRNCPGRLYKLRDDRRAVADKDVGLQRNQLFRQGPHAIGIAGCEAIGDLKVLAEG